jgi:hypothetical protein
VAQTGNKGVQVIKSGKSGSSGAVFQTKNDRGRF